MSEKTRINKYIASTGDMSRRKADELIKQGRVKINGNKILEPGIVVGKKDIVELDGKKLKLREKKYIIFNKPPGYITTKEDPNERKTIYDLLPEEVHHLKPAGRLDKESGGLLVLTNDGDLILDLTHPGVHVPKTYRVTVEGKINQNDIYELAKGIEIEKDKTAYAETIFLEYFNKTTSLQMTLYQGYNRQIRRMMESIGHPVISLKRISHGCIPLGKLKKGHFRYLKNKEIQILFNYIKKIKKKLDIKNS